MRARKPLPRLWLVSDARTDIGLDAAIARLPRGAGVIFRHYHLPPAERRHRFEAVRRLCRVRKLMLVLAGSAKMARRWRADGAYGPPAAGITLATAHDVREIARANRHGAAAVLLSPVFATRSHPGARPLGRVRFRLLAQRSRVPVVALGGMTARRARALPGHGWAAIDGLAWRASHSAALIPGGGRSDS
ncbi:MAG: thiamine phosphate synthase [Novosphingobium sp.]